MCDKNWKTFVNFLQKAVNDNIIQNVKNLQKNVQGERKSERKNNSFNFR